MPLFFTGRLQNLSEEIIVLFHLLLLDKVHELAVEVSQRDGRFFQVQVGRHGDCASVLEDRGMGNRQLRVLLEFFLQFAQTLPVLFDKDVIFEACLLLLLLNSLQVPVLNALTWQRISPIVEELFIGEVGSARSLSRRLLHFVF